MKNKGIRATIQGMLANPDDGVVQHRAIRLLFWIAKDPKKYLNVKVSIF